MGDNKENRILINRRYAKKQLRDLVEAILEENGVATRCKRNIKVAYPGEYLEINWFEIGFNDSNDTYRVYFETSNKTYNTELCMKLKVIEHVYDKNNDTVYDVCNVLKCRVSEGYHTFKEKRIESKVVKMHNEVCINNLNSKRKPPRDRFLLTYQYGHGKEILESIINKSLENTSKEFGLVVSKYPDMIIKELKRNVHRQGKNVYHVYSTCLINEGVQLLTCKLIFKELPLSNYANKVNCIEIDSLEVDECRRLDWSRDDLCPIDELEKFIHQSVIKYLK